MTQTDPYRLAGTTGSPGSRPLRTDRTDRVRWVRTLLWLLLLVSAAGNMLASYGAAGTTVHLSCGVVTALCVTVLAAQRLRGRRRGR
jgi:hypothetical protein